jgi:hypothetical protein
MRWSNMARPSKPEPERRTERLTVYLTRQEEEQLNSLSQAANTDKTKIAVTALNRYIQSLEDPPEALRRAKQEAIMRQDREQVAGFVCSKGHTFWLEAAWPAPPRACPACGTDSLMATWSGTVKKGW